MERNTGKCTSDNQLFLQQFIAYEWKSKNSSKLNAIYLIRTERKLMWQCLKCLCVQVTKMTNKTLKKQEYFMEKKE